MMFVAACAARHTRAAKEAVAAGATDVAVAADVRAAPLAGPPFNVTDGRTAVGAFDSVPVRERHVGAIGVVGAQQVGDDREEVEQTPLLQRLTDRLATVAFANGFVLDVWMSDDLIGRSRIGFQRDHPIVMGMALSQITPIQADLKAPEVDVIKFNRVGGHRNRLASPIERDLVEFFVESNEVGMNVTDRSTVYFVTLRFEQIVDCVQFAMQPTQHHSQIALKSLSGKLPVPLL